MPAKRKDNSFVTVNGVTKTIVEWAREMGISKQLLTYRLCQGWDEADAVLRPKGPYRRMKGHDARTKGTTEGATES